MPIGNFLLKAAHLFLSFQAEPEDEDYDSNDEEAMQTRYKERCSAQVITKLRNTLAEASRVAFGALMMFTRRNTQLLTLKVHMCGEFEGIYRFVLLDPLIWSLCSTLDRCQAEHTKRFVESRFANVQKLEPILDDDSICINANQTKRTTLPIVGVPHYSTHPFALFGTQRQPVDL